jgi:Domain of unknown function (DUF1992)
MTERKPSGVSFESWVEKQIRESMTRGEFDNLSLAGKPLPGAGEPDDENWWVRGYLRREAPDVDALPPTVLLRKQVERLPDTVRPLRSEDEVREAVERLNARIRESWRGPAGPQPPVRPVNADGVVRRWAAEWEVTEPAPPPDAGGRGGGGRPWRRRWWRRGRHA